MKNGGIMLTDLITISGYCYRDMPVAGIYDAAALHLDLNMLESLGTCKCISLIAPELIREGNAFAKKREKAVFPDSRLVWYQSIGTITLESPWRRIVAVCKSILVDSGGS
jgi:hypothetical protein